MYPFWDETGNETGDLVDITKENFKKAEGPMIRATNCQMRSIQIKLISFSFHCHVLLLFAGSASDASKVPVRRFFRTSKPTWNSLWEHWPLKSLCVVCLMACGVTKTSRKPWPRCIMTHIILTPILMV